MAIERELKFSLMDPYAPEPEDLAEAFRGSDVRAVPLPEQDVRDRYFDDRARTLRRAGMALRERTVEGRRLATLKTRGRVDGALHEREELELPAEGGGWPADIAARLPAALRLDALEPLLEVRSLRRRFHLHEGGEPVAVLSFDAVEARAPGSEQSAHFDEVELEAEAGIAADRLHAIAERLAAVVQLTATGTTKLERAEALLPLMGA